ncbi:uncharacterized protein LOC121412928 [Lytechinus variegatus]|uniref:uncharacterized protein LOC121412928 n=1 Tax=Lytechinus variegatus TaxID=7654 RepID=UPI001BB24C78|nr:uncharacterized protein LOC121412928 [Lytechinus variegatus]
MIGLSCTEVICSIIVLRLYHTGGRRQIPVWIRRAMLSPLIIRLYSNAECTAMLRAEDKVKELRILNSVTNQTLQNNTNIAAQNHENGTHDTKADDIVKTISKPQRSDNLNMRSDPEVISKTWQEVAIVCDNLLFILLLLVTLVAWLYVLVSFLI